MTASDGSLTATQTFAVNVKPATQNRVPVAVGPVPEQMITLGIATTVDVSSNFSDPDNDALTYTATSSNSLIASVSWSGSVMTITPHHIGNVNITVTASDGSLTASQTIGVTVATGTIEETIVDVCSRTLQVRDAITTNLALNVRILHRITWHRSYPYS